MRPVIFDTDIGTDVDDILALVLLAKAPELQLIGVTTVYGDTLLRARIAQVTRDLLQRKEVAVIPGESRTLTGRQIFWAGLEGYGVPGLDQVQIPNQSALCTIWSKALNGTETILRSSQPDL